MINEENEEKDETILFTQLLLSLSSSLHHCWSTITTPLCTKNFLNEWIQKSQAIQEAAGRSTWSLTYDTILMKLVGQNIIKLWESAKRTTASILAKDYSNSKLKESSSANEIAEYICHEMMKNYHFIFQEIKLTLDKDLIDNPLLHTTLSQIFGNRNSSIISICEELMTIDEELMKNFKKIVPSQLYFYLLCLEQLIRIACKRRSKDKEQNEHYSRLMKLHDNLLCRLADKSDHSLTKEKYQELFDSDIDLTQLTFSFDESVDESVDKLPNNKFPKELIKIILDYTKPNIENIDEFQHFLKKACKKHTRN